MEVFVIWLGVAVVVGIAANTRGRNGLGWFCLAVVLSPLLAGLLLLALPRLSPDQNLQNTIVQASANSVFEPDGVLAGVPYRMGSKGTVDAMLPGGLVHFGNMDQFRAAAEGRDAPPPTDLLDFKDEVDGIRFRINGDSTITAKMPGGTKTYSSWAAFRKATKRS